MEIRVLSGADDYKNKKTKTRLHDGTSFKKNLAGGRQNALNTWNLQKDHPMFCKTLSASSF